MNRCFTIALACVNIDLMNSKHEVLIGPYRSGKSWLLLERALKHCLDQAENSQAKSNLSGETIIIVPSQRYRKLVEKRLNKLINKQIINDPANKEQAQPIKVSGLWGLKILSFYQFCQTYLLQAGIFAKLLPEAAKSALLSAVCNQLVQAGKINKLKPILHSVGTQASILSLIDEWQRAGYTANDISKKVQNAKSIEIQGHREELADIFSAYQKAMRELNYTDQHGSVLQLTDFLNNNKQLTWLSNFIVVDGFDRFNYMQLDLLKALAGQIEQVYVSFDYDQPQDNLFEEYAWKVRSYEQIKTQLGNSFEFKAIASNPSNEKVSIETLSASDRLTEIETLGASDRLAEMAIIAARVKAAIIFDKIKANEIVVTARNLAPYKSAIEAVFKDAGVDYYIDEPIGIETLPIIRFVMSLLAMAQEDFKRKQVIDVLHSPYFSLRAFGLSGNSVELLNTLSLNRKIVASREQWQQALKSEPELAIKVNAIFDALTQPESINSAIDYVKWVEDLIEKVLDPVAINDLEPLAVWKQKEALAQFRKQLAHLIQEENILKKLKQDSGALSYYERLSQLIEKANFAAPSYSPNQVLIASAELVPNQKYKQIYLAGLLEGEFPAIKTNTGFLTGQELEQWRRLRIYIYNPRMEAGFEYALFASLINRASEKLILSYPSIEISSSKDELLPSFFFNAIDIQPEKEQSLSFEKMETSFTSPRNALAYSFWQGQKPAELVASNKLEAIRNFTDNLQEKFSFAEIRSQQVSQSPVNGYLVDHVAASTVKVKLPEYWNAGQLGDYGKCPFQFWLTRMLKITPHQEPEIGLSIQDRGTFYHKALEIFYQNIIEKKIAINLEQETTLKEIFDQAVKQAIDWLEKEAWFRPDEFWQQEKSALAFRLNNFFAAEFNRFVSEMGQYKPYMVEAVFGPDSQYSPLTLTKNGKTIKIRGKIDRIDIETNSFGQNKKLRLIDYKSGSTFISREDFESGRNIQLPIYALAAEKSILPGSNVSGYQYLSISTGKILSSKKQDEISMRDDLNFLEDRVFAFVENIEKGDFSVKPSNDKVCSICMHQTVCRVKEFPRR
jgi:ATP-dependent helicase/nuclease subunit B